MNMAECNGFQGRLRFKASSRGRVRFRVRYSYVDFMIKRSICPSIHPSIHLPIYLSFHASTLQAIYPPSHSSTSVSIHPSIHLFMCQNIALLTKPTVSLICLSVIHGRSTDITSLKIDRSNCKFQLRVKYLFLFFFSECRLSL